MLFPRVIALLKRLPGTLETGESLLFYLDLDIGLHGSILKLSMKFADCRSHSFLKSVKISD